jgi:hypothetical protein
MHLNRLFCIWFVVLLALSGFAQAHKSSGSYITIDVAPQSMTGRLDIALRDLDFVLGLDQDGNGELTWGEVRARHADIAELVKNHLGLKADGEECLLKIGPQQIDEHSDGAYSVLPLVWRCPQTGERLEINYTLFADIDPQHRGLFNLRFGERSQTAVLGGDRPIQQFEINASTQLVAPGGWQALLQFGLQGLWHIWIGFDHILFLLSLLLPAVLVYRSRRWAPAESFRQGGVEVLKVVTAFTVAHSITLTLATLQWVVLPSRLVESTIAASVVLAALNNVWPLFRGQRWTVAFLFGLIHGFGFASVLTDLGLPSSALLVALLGFNLGVEVGQLAIVAVFLPLAWALRSTAFYRRGIMTAGSLLIAALALIWLTERLFDVQLLVKFQIFGPYR